MRASVILRAAQHRTPSIKFLGKRSPPKSVDHTPHPHPASPTHSLPDSFATYRSKAQQHGPLGGNRSNASPFQASTSGYATYGAIGGSAGKSLGSVQPKKGEFFDRSDLPKRFWRTQWSDEEIDAVSSGGASLVV
ncbi:uncharacterized protein A1O9_11294 [Exophiala aquamarina CBS 119918]|uniref:Uncharacterized protein n=1 Tax=Exophiala aquamarina CBS 119918 TaxID=1182545 RepID=A0A072NZ59_9EURO|nr:uncharacterized protein A1O9_11294 [Exophiala aquamarina CBS 119918]KEF52876.1 hypothetical protein A1O9_11294 [Exophiala aquamarina CBS 119918]